VSGMGNAPREGDYIHSGLALSAQGKECVYWVVWQSGYVASVGQNNPGPE
jgi:hypothetical protein